MLQLATEVALDIVDGSLHEPLSCGGSGPSDVGSNKAIGSLVEQTFASWGFQFNHIDPRPSYFAIHQGIGQGPLIDQWSAAGIE